MSLLMQKKTRLVGKTWVFPPSTAHLAGLTTCLETPIRWLTELRTYLRSPGLGNGLTALAKVPTITRLPVSFFVRDVAHEAVRGKLPRDGLCEGDMRHPE